MNSQPAVMELSRAIAPLPRDRVQTLRSLLRMTDALRAHVLGGRIDAAAAMQAERDALLRQFFSESVVVAERKAMVEACCAMLDMDRAVLQCLEINRSNTVASLVSLGRSASLSARDVP